MDKMALVSAFEIERENYNTFSETMSALIARLLASEGIELHSVSHRCKSVNSFKGKLDKKSTYESLEQVTDLAGVRLITHYEDDVDRVAQIIESEFVVDAVNSIDKRKALDPDRFGYLSLHYVISLRADRAALKEYRSFEGLKAEVQIRSILQHTWAEIEHDTGYKSTVEVPKHIRRRFSRLAGLLELADQEFIGIREALKNYSLEIAVQVETAVGGDEDNLDVFIDKVSLAKFYEVDSLVETLDGKISKILGTSVGAGLEHALGDIQRFKVVGIETLSQLKSELAANQDLVLARARYIAKQSHSVDSDIQLRFAISALYLLQVLAAKAESVDAVRARLKKMGFSADTGLAESLIALVQEPLAVDADQMQ